MSSTWPQVGAIARRSVVRTPYSVLMMIVKKAPRNTTATFDQIPIPSQSTMSGSSATRGSAFMKFNHGSMK